MCKVHKRRGRQLNWREQRANIEDGVDRAGAAAVARDEIDIDLSVDPESGGVVVDTPVDIDLSD